MYTDIIPSTTQHLQSCPPWKCRTGCIASCGARTFCPKSREWRSRAHHEPWADHGPRALTSVLRGVPCLSTPACPSFSRGKWKSQRCARLIKLFSEQICLYRQCRNLQQTKDIWRQLYTYRIIFFATAKNGISLPVIVIIIIKKKMFSRQLWYPRNTRMKILPEKRTKARCVQQEHWRSKWKGRR